MELLHGVEGEMVETRPSLACLGTWEKFSAWWHNLKQIKLRNMKFVLFIEDFLLQNQFV